MKTGLFFGSFNPIHMGHLIIAGHLVDNTDLEEVQFVVTPQNPLKNQRNLLDEYKRLELVRAAIDADERLAANDIEFKLPRPSYTCDTLAYLTEKYPTREFALIMGADNLRTLPKWKNGDFLLQHYPIYVYPRPDEPAPKDPLPSQVQVLEDVPMMQISASYIRSSIRKGHSVRYLIPEPAREIINKWGYYE